MKNLTLFQQREIRLCTKFHGLKAAMRDQSIAFARSICLADPAADFLAECKRDIILNSIKHPESIGFTGNRHTKQKWSTSNFNCEFVDTVDTGADPLEIAAYQQYVREADEADEPEDRDELLARLREQFDVLPGISRTMRTALLRMRAGKTNEKDLRRWMPQMRGARI